MYLCVCVCVLYVYLCVCVCVCVFVCAYIPRAHLMVVATTLDVT